jgi:hypothetical protein
LYRAREVKLFDAHATIHAYQKIEFPTLAHFIEDVLDVGIYSVRLDLFEEVQPSELSFIHYVTQTMYLTAKDPSGYTVYEYTEALGTEASAASAAGGVGSASVDSATSAASAAGPDKECRHSELVKRAQERLQEVERVLSQAKLRVHHGRFALPDSYPDGGAM